MAKITKTEELRRRMLAGVEDLMNENRKKMEYLDAEKNHMLGRMSALAAVKATLLAGAKDGK